MAKKIGVKEAMRDLALTYEVDPPATTIKGLTKQILTACFELEESIDDARTIADCWESAAIQLGYVSTEDEYGVKDAMTHLVLAIDSELVPATTIKGLTKQVAMEITSHDIDEDIAAARTIADIWELASTVEPSKDVTVFEDVVTFEKKSIQGAQGQVDIREANISESQISWDTSKETMIVVVWEPWSDHPDSYTLPKSSDSDSAYGADNAY